MGRALTYCEMQKLFSRSGSALIAYYPNDKMKGERNMKKSKSKRIKVYKYKPNFIKEMRKKQMADAVAIYKRVIKDAQDKLPDPMLTAKQPSVYIDIPIMSACIVAEAISNLTLAVDKLADSVEKLKVE